MMDIALLLHLFFTNFPKFVSKRELARCIPSVSYNLRRGGNCLIDRDDPIRPSARSRSSAGASRRAASRP